MLPAGLGILGVSPKALSCDGRCPSRGAAISDLADMIKGECQRFYFPLYAPPLPHASYGLREALNIIFEEGPWRWSSSATITWPRGGVRPSPGMAPEAVRQGTEVVFGYRERHRRPGGYQRCARDRCGVPPLQTSHWARGLSKVAGKVFRIGHLGDLNELMLMGALAGAEMAMLDCRHQSHSGQRCRRGGPHYWRAHDPIPKKESQQEEQFYGAHSTGSIQG